MVSFSCQNCNDTVKKPKLQMHMNRCQAPVDCIDCSTTFDGHSAKWVDCGGGTAALTTRQSAHELHDGGAEVSEEFIS